MQVNQGLSAGENSADKNMHCYGDDASGQCITTRPINQDVASKSAFGLARQWLTECHSTHSACSAANTTAYVPRRLLCVRSTSGAELLHLRETQNAGNFAYSALSYSWGGEQPCKTTKANLVKRRITISVERLPKTIQDAIKVTRELDLSYLWVDSMCIVQDDREDKNQEMPHMSEIYKNAFVTISASSAARCNDGFLQHRKMFGADLCKGPVKHPFRKQWQKIASRIAQSTQRHYDRLMCGLLKERCQPKMWVAPSRLASVLPVDSLALSSSRTIRGKRKQRAETRTVLFTREPGHSRNATCRLGCLSMEFGSCNGHAGSLLTLMAVKRFIELKQRAGPTILGHT